MEYKPADMGDFLKGPELRSIVLDIAELGVAAYRSAVTVDTGQNQREVRAYTRLGGMRGDRWTGVVLAYAKHAAARNYGNTRTPRPDRAIIETLNMLGTL